MIYILFIYKNKQLLLLLLLLLFYFLFLNSYIIEFKWKFTLQKLITVISFLLYPSYSVLFFQSSTSISLKPETKYYYDKLNREYNKKKKNIINKKNIIIIILIYFEIKKNFFFHTCKSSSLNVLLMSLGIIS